MAGGPARDLQVRALLDEHLSPSIAGLLRSRGLDVQAVSDCRELTGATDDALFDVAAGEDRAVVTGDVKDFRPIAQQRIVDGIGHGGLILVAAPHSRSKAATGTLAAALESVMRDHPSGIADREVWLTP
jgi:hypothetical protein